MLLSSFVVYCFLIIRIPRFQLQFFHQSLNIYVLCIDCVHVRLCNIIHRKKKQSQISIKGYVSSTGNCRSLDLLMYSYVLFEAGRSSQSQMLFSLRLHRQIYEKTPQSDFYTILKKRHPQTNDSVQLAESAFVSFKIKMMSGKKNANAENETLL